MMETSSNITKLKHEISTVQGSSVKKVKFVFREPLLNNLSNSANCEEETSSSENESFDDERGGLGGNSSLDLPTFDDEEQHIERGNRKRERNLVASQAIDTGKAFSPLNKNGPRRS